MSYRPVITFDLFCDGAGCRAQERFETSQHMMPFNNIELDPTAPLPNGWEMRTEHDDYMDRIRRHFCPRCVALRARGTRAIPTHHLHNSDEEDDF